MCIKRTPPKTRKAAKHPRTIGKINLVSGKPPNRVRLIAQYFRVCMKMVTSFEKIPDSNTMFAKRSVFATAHGRESISCAFNSHLDVRGGYSVGICRRALDGGSYEAGRINMYDVGIGIGLREGGRRKLSATCPIARSKTRQQMC